MSGALGSARGGRLLALVVLFALLLVVPLVYHDAYYLTVIVTALIVLTLNISWNFVLGIAGVWNFGQLAIYAIGAYGTGYLMLHVTALPAVLAIVVGGAIAGAVAVALAVPTLRLFGIYTSLLTFAFAQVVQYVALNDPGGLTGGAFGFPTVPGLFPHASQADGLRNYYWVALSTAALATVAVAWLRASRLGVALRALRDAPAYAAARGVDPLRARVAAFGISGFIAGVAGGLYISFNQSITGAAMGLTPMSIDVTMLVIGGLGTIFGPVLGTALLTIIQTALVSYPGVQLTILGALLLVIVVFVPGGLVGAIARVDRRVRAWVAEG